MKFEVPVDGFAWIANRWIEVPTPTGLQQMRLRRGHLSYRIKGQGFLRKVRTACGLHRHVVPLFPEELSSKQEAQIDRLIATNSGRRRYGCWSSVVGWNQSLEKWQARLPPKSGPGAQG